MPIYEYRCNDCGKTFEKLVFNSSQSENVECEHCKSKNTEKLVSAISSAGFSSGSTGGSCGYGGFS